MSEITRLRSIQRHLLNFRVREFRAARRMLAVFKEVEFPMGTPVSVVAPGRFTGHGIASIDGDCPADKVAVLLENGNTWYYEIECVTRITAKELHPAVRRMWLQRRGYTAMWASRPKHLP